MIIESWLNERTTNESRGAVFAVYLSITYFALTAGQFGVAAGDPRADTLFMVGVHPLRAWPCCRRRFPPPPRRGR